MTTASQHVLRLGQRGAAGTLVFVHATGLNASSYRPLLQALNFEGEILAPTLRGHGLTQLPAHPERLISWELFANDICELISHEDLKAPLFLAGHSAGAVTALLAARRLPVRSVLMIEPVVIPRWSVIAAKSPMRRAFMNRLQVAKQAAARRSDFSSREAAESYYRPKAFFRGWDPAAFAGYLEEGLKDIEGGAELACTPAWESAMFKAQAHGFWPHLEEVLKQNKHAAILAAQGRSTFPISKRPRAVQLGARVTEEEGGHMLPVEAPGRTADWMRYELEGTPPPTRV